MPSLDLRTTAPASRRAGFTAVEATLVATVLVIALLGLVASVGGGARLVVTNRETALAHQAARGVAEGLRAADFELVFARFNADPDDDPGAPGSAPGRSFPVPGLNARTDDVDGAPGEIVFPTVGGLGSELAEDFVDARLGMPRDLDGDGVVEVGALVGDYALLPVRVLVRWRGVGGERELVVDSLLVAR